MKLYEINAALEALLSNVDEETGEVIVDAEALDALLMERTDKLEGIALAVKNLTAEADAIKAEEKSLAERRKALEKRRDGLRRFLQDALNGEKFQTARCAVSYRKSQAVEIDPALFWEHPAAEFVRVADPEPDKNAIKAALKEGAVVPGAELVETVSMQVR